MKDKKYYKKQIKQNIIFIIIGIVCLFTISILLGALLIITHLILLISNKNKKEGCEQ